MFCVLLKRNPSSLKNSAAIVSENDKVNKFALLTTAKTERDFKSDYLFRTCAVANNLVASLEIHSDYAVMLCRF